MTQPQNAPSCFGKYWQSSAPECYGGPDSGYYNKRTKSHVRDQCLWYTACYHETNRGKANPKPPPSVVPVSNLTKNLQRPPAPAQSHPMVGTKAAYPPQQQQQYYYPYANQQIPHPIASAMAQMVPPWMAQMGPMAAPAQYQAPGAQMPGYLAVNEHRGPEDGYLKPLGGEIVRSVGKAGAHTIASYLDHNPINRHPIPVEPEEE